MPCKTGKGIKISHVGIKKWIDRYGQVAAKYMDSIKPRTGGKYRADEIYMKINGEQKYLFASMDDSTRFWIASDLADRKEGHDASVLFKKTLDQTGKIPDVMITDGLHSYSVASRAVLPLTEHVKEVHNRGRYVGKDNNNKMERLNDTIRDREKTFRGLKKMDTKELCGMRVNYNHVRKHGAIKKTPGEATGIEIEGLDKWRAMIQTGSLLIHQTGEFV